MSPDPSLTPRVKRRRSVCACVRVRVRVHVGGKQGGLRARGGGVTRRQVCRCRGAGAGGGKYRKKIGSGGGRTKN